MLGSLDLIVLVVWVLGTVAFGAWFWRTAQTRSGFTVADGALPGWIVGLSIFGTFLSSNTFLGVPGKAFSTNWNAFVFSLSLPLAAFLAVRYFVPFYRQSGEVSAYAHLENRFGRWARLYATTCYLATQVARVATILFGVALALGALTGWSPAAIILATGLLVTAYSWIGGVAAVIFTDVAQSVVLTLGALLVAVILLTDMPGGAGELFAVAADAERWSLGSWSLDPRQSTVWVVLVYGLFINLTNFGIDQSYVQRYHVARSEKEARRSVWLAAALYLPISALFFFLGSGLFAWYETHPEARADLVAEVMVGELDRAVPIEDLEARIGDRAFPHFLVNRLPPGVGGLVLAALLAAAMSSIDTSLNGSATVILSDFVEGWQGRQSEGASMAVLRIATGAMGLLGTGAALLMIGTSSLLDAWWTLSGIFAGGMLGLFLLGLLARRSRAADALFAVLAGVAVILYLSLSPRLVGDLAWLASPLHANMTIVLGTLTIVVVGSGVARLRSA